MYRLSLNSSLAKKAPIVLLRPLAGAVLMALSGMGSLQAEELEFLGAHGNAANSAGLGGASGLAVSPDNRYIYVAAATDHGLGMFKKDADGQPTYLNFYPAAPDLGGIQIPVKVLVTPDGADLYVLFNSFDKGRVALYHRNASNGELTFYKGYDGLSNVSDLAISGDGKNLYLTGANAIVVFKRDAATGELANIDTKIDGQEGVDGIAGSSGLTLTPDGKYLFVAGMSDDAVAVFTRSTTTGKLGFVEALRNDPAKGVTGLGGATSIALSPDGVNLYVAGAKDNAIAVFKRNFISGKLTYLEAWTQGGINGQNMVPELNGVSSIAVSHNGSRVYASSIKQDVIAVFNALPQSRKLEFMEVQAGGHWMLTMTMSPGGSYLYAASPVDGAGKVAVFRTANTAPIASNDVAEVDAGSAITLHVLANDNDPDNDVLKLAGADSSSKQGGTVSVNGDGSITYTAPVGFKGVDGFSYFLSDVRDAKPVVAQVSVTVTQATPPTPASTGGEAQPSGSGGGGGLDGWFGMLLLSAVAIRRRVVQC